MSSIPSPRWPRIALAVLFGCAALWHALPHWTWRLYLEPELAALPTGHRLDVPFLELEFEGLADFSAVAYEGIALRVPSRGIAPPSCKAAESPCQLELAHGRVVIHATAPPEDFWQMVWLRAPDRSDLSWLRSASFNWRAIEALRTRVTTSRSHVDSWRFESPQARGVVAQTQREQTANYVVAAYERGGRGARVLGVSNLPRGELLELLASIRFIGLTRGE